MFCNIVIDKDNGSVTSLDDLIIQKLIINNGQFVNNMSFFSGEVEINDSWLMGAEVRIVNNFLIMPQGQVNAQGNTIQIDRDWNCEGEFIHGNNQVMFKFDETNQSISGNCAFYDLYLDNTNLSLQSHLTIQHHLINNNSTLNANGYDIYLGGNWETDNGHFIHGNGHVYLNTVSGDHSLDQDDSFYNLTIGTPDTQGSIQLEKAIRVDNQLSIIKNNTLDVDNHMVSVGSQFNNRGAISTNGGILDFSNPNNETGNVLSNMPLANFEEVRFICEQVGERWYAMNSLTIDSPLTIDGCYLYASFLTHSNTVDLLNNGQIIGPTAIPSLNQWGILIMIVLLVFMALVSLQRKRVPVDL